MGKKSFTFQQFTVRHDRCAMKVGTDGVLLGAWAQGGERILDIGTGTAVVALMMAQRFPHAQVTGVEVDAEAYSQATENVRSSKFADRIQVIHGRIQDCDFPQAFDSVVCNPPFFMDSLRNPDMRRAIARHNDLLPFDELFSSAHRFMSEKGVCTVVIPHVVSRAILDAAHHAGLYLSRRCDLRAKAEKEVTRHLLAFTKHPVEGIPTDEEVVYAADNVRSPWYQSITSEFYLTPAQLAALKSVCG